MFNIEKEVPSLELCKRLKELGLLNYTRTRAYTMYKLVLPKEIEDSVLWLQKSTEHTPEPTVVGSSF